MQIIRDGATPNAIQTKIMTGLLIQSEIYQCNIRDCYSKPNTIVIGYSAELPLGLGLCNAHYNKYKLRNGLIDLQGVRLEFQTYDAMRGQK